MRDLSQSKQDLSSSWQQLLFRFESTREVWADAARQDFEKEYWIDFESGIAVSIEKLGELIEVIAQAEREIS